MLECFPDMFAKILGAIHHPLIKIIIEIMDFLSFPLFKMHLSMTYLRKTLTCKMCLVFETIFIKGFETEGNIAVQNTSWQHWYGVYDSQCKKTAEV